MSDDFLPVPDRRSEYSPETYTRAFHIWAWDADRHYHLTAARLAEIAAADAELAGRDPARTPSHDTIRYWALNDDWPARVHAILASDGTARKIFDYQRGQMLIMRDNLLLQFAEVANLPNDNPAIINVKVKIYAEINKTLEPHTATQPTAPTLTPPRPIEAGKRDRNTVSQEQLARIQKAKHERKGKS